MRLLFLYRNKFPSSRKNRPEEIAQIGCHLDHLTIVSTFRHPDNGIQRVIEKMRTDLLLKEPQLQLTQIFLLLSCLIQKTADTVTHLIEGLRQNTDLLQTSCPGPRIQISAAELFSSLSQFP